MAPTEMRRLPPGSLVLLVWLAAAPVASTAADLWLRDVTEEVGLDFRHLRAGETRYRLPEIMSGGACWLDYDRDGDLDLYLVQGGALAGDTVVGAGAGDGAEWGNALFRNEGGSGFARVTTAAGVGDTGYGMGCAVGDVDGDGWVDLYVTNLGPNVLYRNAADGSFRALSSGAEDAGWGASAAFFDYDRDGDLDLFVVNYVEWTPAKEMECFSGGLRDYCHPDRYDAPAPDRLFRNRGDGTFDDVTAAAGVDAAFGNGLGVTVGDFDGDGRPDVYVANDGMANQLWTNQGDGTFRDEALLAGVALNRLGEPEAGMGVQAFDVGDDATLDLFVTHLRGESNTLYRNDGAGLFADRTATSGLGAVSLGSTGFGVGFADFDSDGLVDLYVANGRVGRGLDSHGEDPFAEPDHLYRGRDDGGFERLAAGAVDPATPILATRAAALGDADLDGDVDVLVVGNGGTARLLENVAGDGGRWLAARVLDAEGGDLLGARVTLTSGAGRRLRVVQPA